ncbi:MAG: hypothetical protein LQ347_005602 [Umbilicaria vellea]|nr:MAG: hypothetical protein LQ347_005602 [Umbilicaria vellea]
MDPVIAIGFTGSVLGIIDVVTKSVQTLQNLQGQYKRADLTASLLVGQLSTLKAALFLISDLANMDLVKAPQHHQLMADLTISLECCGVLIRVLDDRLQELQRDEHGALRAVLKAKLVWQEKDMVDIRDHLNHQTDALNLFLTAS